MSSVPSDCKVVQVLNVHPQLDKETLRAFFQYVGKIEEIVYYPDANIGSHTSCVAFVRFSRNDDVRASIHLNNTVFNDKALIIHPFLGSVIPDESEAMIAAAPPCTVAAALPKTMEFPWHVIHFSVSVGQDTHIVSRDINMKKAGFPDFPPILGNTTEATRVEEIRRTIYVSNLIPTVSAEQVLAFFSQIGEIKYVRLAGSDQLRAAYIEFSRVDSILPAMRLKGTDFQGQQIYIQHSLCPITKPSLKRGQIMINNDFDEAMRRVREASSLISSYTDRMGISAPPRPRRRSRSGDRDRGGGSRRVHHKRSRSRDRSRRASRDRRRSRSRDRKRSRSRDRKRRSSRDRKGGHRSSRDQTSRSSKRSGSRDRHHRTSNSSKKEKKVKRERRSASSSSSEDDKTKKNGGEVKEEMKLKEEVAENGGIEKNKNGSTPAVSSPQVGTDEAYGPEAPTIVDDEPPITTTN